jgi:hypothetical protein
VLEAVGERFEHVGEVEEPTLIGPRYQVVTATKEENEVGRMPTCERVRKFRSELIERIILELDVLPVFCSKAAMISPTARSSSG